MPIRVLVVDPEHSIAESFAKSLRQHGFEVLTASNEGDCLRQLCESALDLVVLEPDAHDTWGRNVLKRRDREGVPFIVISRFSPSRDAESEDTLWLTKPVSLDALVAAVRRAVGVNVNA